MNGVSGTGRAFGPLQACRYPAAFCDCQTAPPESGMDASADLVWVCQPII